MTKLINFRNRVTKQDAILHAYNSYFRVLDGDNVEYIFHCQDKAILFLMNKGYSINVDVLLFDKVS